MRPFSKCPAVRTPSTSRFNLISLGHSAVDDAPPIVSGIEGPFRLSKMAVRKELRNCSLTAIVASAAGALLQRRFGGGVVPWPAAARVRPVGRETGGGRGQTGSERRPGGGAPP